LLAATLITIGCSGSNTTGPSTSSGTFTQTDLVVGTGTEATTGKSVTVAYDGWLYDTSKTDGKGKFFNGGTAFTFTLGTAAVRR
jgi:FKBP-type peptidyl-prolyl cis-trans isomerase FkpA